MINFVDSQRLFFIVFFVLVAFSKSKFLGAYIAPHGSIVLGPARFRNRPLLFDMINTLYSSYVTTVHDLLHTFQKDSRSPRVLVTTPHGRADRRLGFYMSSRGVGDAGGGKTMNYYSQFSVNVSLDETLTKDIVDELVSKHFMASTLQHASGTSEFPLLWGSAVPMYFLEQALASNESSSSEGGLVEDLEYVVMSFPTSQRLQNQYLLSLGKAMYDILEARDEEIIVLVSADLAHCHKNSFGRNRYEIRPEVSRAYDAAAGFWLESSDSTYLLNDATSMARLGARSCGQAGFVFLEGIRNRAGRDGKNLVGTLIQSPLAPTYFGMMMGKFVVP